LYHPDESLITEDFKSKNSVKSWGGLVYNKKRWGFIYFRNGKWDLPKGELKERKLQPLPCEVEEETGVNGCQYLINFKTIMF
jgi:hypothetical protein